MLKSQRSNYTPLDFLGWSETATLILSPKFQRRQVWGSSAKSFLIDSLIRGMPVPPIYLRVKQSADKTKTIREVVDGQQRVSTVVDFLTGGFALAKNVDSAFQGKKFSQLPEEIQEQIRAYSFICEVMHGIGDAEVLQIFRRMNMYSVPLNAQELRNGRFFGEFKECAFSLAEEHLEFWRRHRLFSEQKIARMGEVEFMSELLVLLLDGLQDKKKSLDVFYAELDAKFLKRAECERRVRALFDLTSDIFPEGLKDVGFNRAPLYYSLFGALAHRWFGVPNIKFGKGAGKGKLSAAERSQIRDAVLTLENVLIADDEEGLRKIDIEFREASSSQTDNLTPRTVRLKRIYGLAFGL